MSSEEILNLFNFYWFEHEVFAKTSALLEPEPEPEPPKLSRAPTLIYRSFSDHALSSKESLISDSPSPKSVLSMPKLQKILSGKEAGETEEAEARKEVFDVGTENRGSEEMRKRRRRKKGSSRSLSELEFEEVKGFMDLGFVFSDEDKDSSLVSIIPGLQRLGKRVDFSDEGKRDFDESAVSRPYLSEAWEVLEERKIENPLMNWRIPAFGNEMELKDHLRFWAHTVASTVR